MKTKTPKKSQSVGTSPLLQNILAAGNRVIIRHYRNATVKSHLVGALCGELKIVTVPSSLREFFDFLPCGGHTEVKIYPNPRNPNQTSYTLNTECRSNENFCYKLGVAWALKNLSEEEYQSLRAFKI